jgi:hypothetical protein
VNGRLGQRAIRPIESSINADQQRNSERSRRNTSRQRSYTDSRDSESDGDSDEDAHKLEGENESSFDGQGSDEDDDGSADLSAGDDDDSLDGPTTRKRKRATAVGHRSREKVNDTARPARKRARQPPEPVDDARASRTRGVRASYEDPSSSEFSDESEEQIPPKRRDGRLPTAKKWKGNGTGIIERLH